MGREPYGDSVGIETGVIFPASHAQARLLLPLRVRLKKHRPAKGESQDARETILSIEFVALTRGNPSFGAGFSDAAAPAKLTHGNRTEAGSARRARPRRGWQNHRDQR